MHPFQAFFQLVCIAPCIVPPTLHCQLQAGTNQLIFDTVLHLMFSKKHVSLAKEALDRKEKGGLQWTNELILPI